MKQTVLWVIDDDEDDRSMIVWMAETVSADCEVLTFDSGDALLAFLQPETAAPAIILIDYQLLMTNAAALTKRLSAIPLFKDTNFYWYSNSPRDRLEAEVDGYIVNVKGVFSKPVYLADWESFFKKIGLI